MGTILSEKLTEKGYRVTHLSRSPRKNSRYKTYSWDIKADKIDKEAVKTADHIIHLAGANIAGKRWIKSYKKKIISSRVDSCKLLWNTIEENSNLKTFISASGIGYYGMITTNHVFAESDPPAKDFLGECCRLWENASKPIEEKNIRRVVVRTAVVLTDKGGALPKMAKPFKYYAGAILGSGDQWMPWISLEDLCNIYIKAIEDKSMSGVYNACSPEQVTNKELTYLISKVLKKPVLLPPVPSVMLKLLIGEMANALLYGSRVSPKKLLDSGFKFNHPGLNQNLSELLGKGGLFL